MAITINNRALNSGKTEREDTVSINGTTTLTASSTDRGSEKTHWQIRRADDHVMVFDFVVDGDGALLTSNFESFFDSDGYSVRLKLDRQYNYQVRTAANDNRFVDVWTDINMHGALRIFGPRHLDSYETLKKGTGAQVRSNNNKFTVQYTDRGATVSENFQKYRKPRTLRIPYKKSTSGQ